MSKIREFAICVGHSRRIKGTPEGGAVSVGGVSEWEYNRDIAARVQAILKRYVLPSVIVDDYQGRGYDAAQRWLAGHLKALNVIAAVELHFNSADPLANGHEHLHHPHSRHGKRLADDLSTEFRIHLPEIRVRGAKPRFKGNGVENRGWQFLYYPPMPSVIVESGFGSNEKDWQVLNDKRHKVALAIADGIASWLE
jgi:N-acetylmuramoyl-L-alanine amidase